MKYLSDYSAIFVSTWSKTRLHKLSHRHLIQVAFEVKNPKKGSSLLGFVISTSALREWFSVIPHKTSEYGCFIEHSWGTHSASNFEGESPKDEND